MGRYVIFNHLYIRAVIHILKLTVKCIKTSSGGGKTFVHKILDNTDGMWYGGVPPVKIIYCYGQWQPYFNQIEKDITDIIFHNGLPNTLPKILIPGKVNIP